MANRYWVGGTASWDATAGTKWALTSGGAGGQTVPTSADDVFFDAASGVVTVSVDAFQPCNNLDFTGFTGTITTVAFGVNVFGNLTFAPLMGDQFGFVFNFDSTTTGKTITCNGYGSTANFNFRGVGGGWSLSDAFGTGGDITVTNGTFNTNGFTVYANALSSNNSNTRTINLSNSSLFLSGAVNFNTTTGLTFNAGTSTISMAGSLSNLNVAASGLTFYNVAFSAANQATPQIFGANTFNNLSIVSRISSGIKNFVINDNQTINGTFTVSGGVDATRRTFVRSNISTSVRTLTCAAVSLADADFRAITIAGAAAPASGTRLGDCKGNSGITFTAAKTAYWNLAGGGNWSSTGWAATVGGSPAANNFPLAQDAAAFMATGLNSGATVTINAAYNIGTIDMSSRTSNTMTLATGSLFFSVYGSWINGTGTTISGSGIIFFEATNTGQTITSAGKTFTQALSIVGGATGSVTLQDALIVNNSLYGGIALNSGTFNANGFNVTLSDGGMQAASGTDSRTLAIGSGTWTVASAGASAWNTGGTGFSVTGTGTISMTSFSSKTFSGNGVAYTNITLNQGGSGTLTITGSNTFANITNTYASTGATTITFPSSSTTTVGSFTASGQSGRVLTINRSGGTAATLSKASGTVSVDFCSITGSTATGGAAWYAGANSTNVSGNTGWIFTAPPLVTATGNMLMMFF